MSLDESGKTILDQIDIGELVTPLAGQDWWVIPAGAGVPSFKVTDGPSGVRGERFTGGPVSVNFPCGAAMGATWDVELAARVGAALAAETKAKGAHVLLGPTVNLQRSPLGGRHFECFSEDPLLTAAIASAWVRGLQANGVAACVKHLVANDAEVDRFQISSEVDERTLRETSLLPFEWTLRGEHAWSTMAAYNRVNGVRATEHVEVLTNILRDEWGWDGVVISDWFATRSTAASALAGMDIEMPGPPMYYGAHLAKAVVSGEVPRAVVEALVRRVGLLTERVGASARPPAHEQAGGAPEVVALAREAAAGSLVLLRNVDGALPLDPAGFGTVAVIGPNATREIAQGGGSAQVPPTEIATVLDAFRDALGAERVVHAAGCGNGRGTPRIEPMQLRRADGSHGADITITSAGREVTLANRDFRLVADPSALFGTDVGTDWALRAVAHYTPLADGEHGFNLRTNLNARIFVAGQEVTERDPIALAGGEPVEISIEATATPASTTGLRASLELRCEPPAVPTSIDDAARAAAAADAAVVVIGLDGEWETEGRDRDDLSLPGDQVALIRAVAAAQRRTVVVVAAGSPVDVSWSDKVPAILWASYPGQAAAAAIVDAVLGRQDPAGRLPFTIPTRIEDTPAFLDVPPDPGRIHYSERVFVGHRWYDARGVEPAYCFGHGGSYTTFSHGQPTLVPAAPEAGAPIVIDVPLTNTGARPGAEVVQAYLSGRPGPGRHPHALVGFAKAHLAPGESRTVRVTLAPRTLAWWDVTQSTWRAEPGTYRIEIARSSRDIVASVDVELAQAFEVGPEWWPSA